MAERSDERLGLGKAEVREARDGGVQRCKQVASNCAYCYQFLDNLDWVRERGKIFCNTCDEERAFVCDVQKIRLSLFGVEKRILGIESWTAIAQEVWLCHLDDPYDNHNRTSEVEMKTRV